MSQAEKLTNRMFRQSLILKIIAAVLLLFILICVAIYIYDRNPRDIRSEVDLDAGMEELLAEVGATSKTIPPLEVEYKDGWNKSLIRIRSCNAPNIHHRLEQKEAGERYSLFEYPDISAYLYVVAYGHVSREATIRHYIFGENAIDGFWRTTFFDNETYSEWYQMPQYRHYIMIEIQKDSEQGYWIYAEMNHPSFVNDVMKEAFRQINAFEETDG